MPNFDCGEAGCPATPGPCRLCSRGGPYRDEPVELFDRARHVMLYDWLTMLGRCLWYAGMWKRQACVRFSPATISKILGDLRISEFIGHMPGIVAGIPNGDGQWHPGSARLEIRYPRFAEPDDASFSEADVLRVFEHWSAKLHPRAQLGKARRRVIEARLAEGIPVDRLIAAVDGLAKSSKHREKGWTDLTLILRDESHVDKYARWAAGKLPDLLRDEPESGNVLERMRGQR